MRALRAQQGLLHLPPAEAWDGREAPPHGNGVPEGLTGPSSEDPTPQAHRRQPLQGGMDLPTPAPTPARTPARTPAHTSPHLHPHFTPQPQPKPLAAGKRQTPLLPTQRSGDRVVSPCPEPPLLQAQAGVATLGEGGEISGPWAPGPVGRPLVHTGEWVGSGSRGLSHQGPHPVLGRHTPALPSPPTPGCAPAPLAGLGGLPCAGLILGTVFRRSSPSWWPWPPQGWEAISGGGPSTSLTGSRLGGGVINSGSLHGSWGG